MHKRGFVSLWAGTFESADELQNYMLINFTEDGDAIPSMFERDFLIKEYDTDFQEIDFYDNFSTKLTTLLEGFSYDEKIIPKFINLLGEELSEGNNSIVLLYNFKYNKQIKESKNLKYLGTVYYE